MRIRQFHALILTVAVGLPLVGAGRNLAAQGKKGLDEAKQVVDPEAKRILKAMSDCLGVKKQLRFKVYDTIEIVDGDKLVQNSNTLSFWIQRPNKIKAVIQGDIHDREAVYDGVKIIVHERIPNAYMIKTNAPDTIEGLLAYMAEQEGIVMPVSDFFVSDVYGALTGNVENGAYLGLGQVRGVNCHHLYFQQKNIDWQIWIDDDEKAPLPRKLVIDYKNADRSPSYTAYFDAWDFAPIEDPNAFAFTPPADAEKIEFLSDLKKSPKKESAK